MERRLWTDCKSPGQDRGQMGDGKGGEAGGEAGDWRVVKGKWLQERLILGFC